MGPSLPFTVQPQSKAWLQTWDRVLGLSQGPPAGWLGAHRACVARELTVAREHSM